eukprot:11113412-Prorocentrum_lima.AAC.1
MDPLTRRPPLFMEVFLLPFSSKRTWWPSAPLLSQSRVPRMCLEPPTRALTSSSSLGLCGPTCSHV